jgi:hypothetical protein
MVEQRSSTPYMRVQLPLPLKIFTNYVLQNKTTKSLKSVKKNIFINNKFLKIVKYPINSTFYNKKRTHLTPNVKSNLLSKNQPFIKKSTFYQKIIKKIFTYF